MRGDQSAQSDVSTVGALPRQRQALPPRGPGSRRLREREMATSQARPGTLRGRTGSREATTDPKGQPLQLFASAGIADLSGNPSVDFEVLSWGKFAGKKGEGREKKSFGSARATKRGGRGRRERGGCHGPWTVVLRRNTPQWPERHG